MASNNQHGSDMVDKNHQSGHQHVDKNHSSGHQHVDKKLDEGPQQQSRIQSFMSSFNKKKEEEKYSADECNQAERNLLTLIDQVKDKKLYDSIDDFIFFKQMGIDKNVFNEGEKKVQCQIKYDQVQTLAFAWQEHVMYIFQGQTAEDKNKGIKKGRYGIEFIADLITDENDKKLITSRKRYEVIEDNPTWSNYKQIGQWVYMINKKEADSAILEVIKINILDPSQPKKIPLKTKETYESFPGQQYQLFEYEGRIYVFMIGRLKGKEERFCMEILGEDEQSYYQKKDITDRNQYQDYLQYDNYVHYIYFDGDGKKAVEKIVKCKFDMKTNKLEGEGEKIDFDSKLNKIEVHGYSQGLPEQYELQKITSYKYIRNMDNHTERLPYDETMVMFELFDEDTDLKYRSIRRCKDLNTSLWLSKFTSDYIKFTYGHTFSHWVYVFIKKDGDSKVDVSQIVQEREAKKEYKECDNFAAKVLIHYDHKGATEENKKYIIEQEGDPESIKKCLDEADKEKWNYHTVLMKAEQNMIEVNKNPDKNEDQTWAIRIFEDSASRFDREGREGNIQQFRRQDPQTVEKFERIESTHQYLDWNPRYIQIFYNLDENRPDSTTEWRSFEQFDYACAMQYFRDKYVIRDQSVNVIENQIDETLQIMTSKTEEDKNGFYVKMWDLKYKEKDINIPLKYEKAPQKYLEKWEAEKQIQNEQEKGQINEEIKEFEIKMTLKTDEKQDGLRQIKMQYQNKDPITIETFMSIEHFEITKTVKQNDGWNEIYFTGYRNQNYVRILKEYLIQFKIDKNKKEGIDSRFNLIGCKFIYYRTNAECKMFLEEESGIDEQNENKPKKLFLYDPFTFQRLEIKDQDNYRMKFDSNNLKSTFYYYTQDRAAEYLCIDIGFCCPTQMQEVQKLLSFAEIDLTMSSLITVLMNMKPKRTMREFWLNDELLFDIDLFQHREDLMGFSYASVLTKLARDFENKLKVKRVHREQRSLLDEYIQRTGRWYEHLKEENHRLFSEPIQPRETKEVCIGVDFKCNIQHCMYKTLQDLSACQSVIVQTIKFMKKKLCYHHQLSIQMLVPHLLFHEQAEEDPICEEGAKLFVDFLPDDEVSSFFTELTLQQCPTYFSFQQATTQIDKFVMHNHHKLEPKVEGSNEEQKSQFKSKDLQSALQVKKLSEEEGSGNDDKLSRTFLMPKEFYNINVILRQHQEIQDKNFFNYDVPFTEYEQGKLLSKIISQFPYQIEYLSNLRAMIDTKFDKETFYFFLGQQALYLFGCILPFAFLASVSRNSHWIIPLLVISQLGQTFFIFLEYIQLDHLGREQYFGESNNFFSYSQFLFHVVYLILKSIDYSIAVKNDDDTNDPASALQNFILMLMIIIFCLMLGNVQHLIKIYKDYGRLTVLIVKSIKKVVPFMVIFMVWTTLFAIQYLVLKSNYSDATGYSGLPVEFGYIIVSFENGIGNIVQPTVNDWMPKEKFSQQVIVFLVYFAWFLNQFILLVVLLNFVIALISEVYEMVTDHKMMHQYIQRQDLNTENDLFKQFLKKTFGKKDEGAESHIAQMILVSSIKKVVSEDEEWLGLIQTFKKFINEKVVIKFKEMKDDLIKEQGTLVEDVKLLERQQTLGLDSLKKEAKYLVEVTESMQKKKKSGNQEESEDEEEKRKADPLSEIKDLKKEVTDVRENIDELQKDLNESKKFRNQVISMLEQIKNKV